MELIFNVVIAGFLIFYIFLAMQLGASTTDGDIFGAGGFPIFIAIVGLIVLGVITRNVIKDNKKIEIPMFNLKTAGGRSVTTNLVALSVYVILLNYLGFIFSTPIFLLSSAKSMGYSNNKALGVFIVLTTLALVVLFGKVFFIPLPRGIGVLRELSYFIY